MDVQHGEKEIVKTSAKSSTRTDECDERNKEEVQEGFTGEKQKLRSIGFVRCDRTFN